MMPAVLAQDEQRRPDLFRWNGPVHASTLRAWLENNAWMGQIPHDLVVLWQETGGGEIFESENILGPAGGADEEDIAKINVELRQRGLRDQFVVFHQGSFLCAVDTTSADYVELNPNDFHVLRHFRSLDEWYLATVRAEFAARYGL